MNKNLDSPAGPVVKPAGSKKIIVLRESAKSGGKKEKVFKLDKQRVVIGSLVSADIKLTGDGVAPIHAVLELGFDAKTQQYFATIFDLASDAGVFVNGSKVVTQVLSEEDEIVVGRHSLIFHLEELNRTGRDRIRDTEGRALFLNPEEDFVQLNLEDERQIIEIFDYRPAAKRALEVVMSWNNVILDVEHFVEEKKVTVGPTQKSDFAIPAGFSSKHYPIVTRTGGEFVLNLDEKMNGVMQKSGELQTLEVIRRHANQGQKGYKVTIGNDDFAKVSIKDIDFYFSYTAAPPRLKRRRLFERDPFFQRIFALSMIFTVLALFSLSKVPLPKNIEPEQIPERIATILYQPEKYLQPPPPVEKPLPKPKQKEIEKPVEKPAPKITPKLIPQHKPKPVETPTAVTKPAKAPVEQPKPQPKVQKPVAKPAPVVAKPAERPRAQPEAKEGEGARAKGKEGSRGEPNKKPSRVKVTEMSRPSPKTGAKGASGNSQVSEEGNVDLLKGVGGRIQNILGNSAAHLGSGGEKLKGFGNFSTEGSGGLALSGSGTGGGGDAETTLGGLGKKGSGMGRVGTGKGAAGSGNGIIGSQVRVAIRAGGSEESVVMGAIDRDAVEAAILAHRDEFRLCYEKEINADTPNIAGRIHTSFVIGSSGRVTKAGIESSTLKNANAEHCVLTVLKRIDFPMPRGGGIAEIRYPFVFSSAGH